MATNGIGGKSSSGRTRTTTSRSTDTPTTTSTGRANFFTATEVRPSTSIRSSSPKRATSSDLVLESLIWWNWKCDMFSYLFWVTTKKRWMCISVRQFQALSNLEYTLSGVVQVFSNKYLSNLSSKHYSLENNVWLKKWNDFRINQEKLKWLRKQNSKQKLFQWN